MRVVLVKTEDLIEKLLFYKIIVFSCRGRADWYLYILYISDKIWQRDILLTSDPNSAAQQTSIYSEDTQGHNTQKNIKLQKFHGKNRTLVVSRFEQRCIWSALAVDSGPDKFQLILAAPI